MKKSVYVLIVCIFVALASGNAQAEPGPSMMKVKKIHLFKRMFPNNLQSNFLQQNENSEIIQRYHLRRLLTKEGLSKKCFVS